MTEVIEAPPAPAKAEPPASLKALFQIPSDLVEVVEPEIVPNGDKPPVEPPPIEPKPVSATPVAEPKKTDLTSRLAPDFAALETPPVVPAAPDPDLAELDAAIEEAKTPKKKADLTKFRDQLASLKTENQTLKSKPVTPAADPDAKTLLESATRERDEAWARLERLDLAAHPAFQEKYLKPRQQKFDDAYNLVKEAGGNPEALRHAMALVGEPRIEALEGIAESIPHQMMRGRFERLIEGIDADSRTINEKLQKARQTAEEEAKNETIRRHENNEKAAKEWKSLLGAARTDLMENVKLEALVKVDRPGFEWWNNQIDEDDAVAEEILLKSTPQKAAVAAVLASKCGTYRSMWQAERELTKVQAKEIAELKGAEPTLTRERIAAKVEGDGVAPDDILSRLRTGAYKK